MFFFLPLYNFVQFASLWVRERILQNCKVLVKHACWIYFASHPTSDKGYFRMRKRKESKKNFADFIQSEFYIPGEDVSHMLSNQCTLKIQCPKRNNNVTT